jgi:hypothetical protein
VRGCQGDDVPPSSLLFRCSHMAGHNHQVAHPAVAMTVTYNANTCASRQCAAQDAKNASLLIVSQPLLTVALSRSQVLKGSVLSHTLPLPPTRPPPSMCWAAPVTCLAQVLLGMAVLRLLRNSSSRRPGACWRLMMILHQMRHGRQDN